ncbi:hypothetical protein M2451_000249 [Dysgonomonas sp. PFB1-18]|uniref:RDD family protein n=1 Tax=unclassified Dysgonomonas TaxID=2630389 RepID=UPI0024731BBA|nr:MULTISPECIES: RDD family protein [unclassified Dysgonomonas]MDL2303039.1 RDD family protein [Dysgonomonas sp. OttesenSCG-928-D17]MDH6307800.1 hypothetical protein [Dysgonomonas sp. PF1-14]MDH6337718.1 hypothetical protein [Dysgonomonas sp. PF1-16]MDH6378942.1 hypothetical protein [Dysgonomonas sp. PFB1-18]MDH6396577.1 hypothetical protein [Dysgonomonas sp. PF1-23]
MDKKLRLIAWAGCVFSLYSLFTYILYIFMGDKTPSTIFSFSAVASPVSFLRELALVVGFIINILFLSGSVLCLKTNGREVRLLRFCFSLVFIYNVVPILSILIFELKNMSVLYALILLIKISFLVVSYLALKHMTTLKSLKVESYKLGDAEISNYVETTGWQRFSHLVTDLLLLMFFFYPWVIWLGRLMEIPNSIAASFLAVCFIILQLFFYILFETIFGATPGKYLTESRTIKNDMDSLPVGTAILRSFCRIIPFERIAFLLGSRWHDNWSDTNVVREEQTGVSGKSYLIGILGVIVSCTAIFYGAKFAGDMLEKADRDKQYETEKQTERDNLLKRAERVSTEAFLVFEKDWYKVERISNDTLYTVFVPTDSYSPDISSVYNSYNSIDLVGDSLIPILKSELITSVKNDVKMSYLQEGSVHIGNKGYELKNIIYIDEPAISRSGGGNYRYSSDQRDNYGEFSLSFYNDGWPLKVVEMEQRLGDIEWDHSPLNNTYTDRYFSLNGVFKSGDKDFETLFIHETPLGERRRYLLKIHKDRSGYPNAYIEELD